MISAENTRFRCLQHRLRRHFSPLRSAADRSSLCQAQQPATDHVQIRQRARHEQPMRVLRQAFVARLREPEDSLDDQKRVFDLRPHARLRLVLRPLDFVHHPFAPVATICHVLGRRSVRSDDGSLTLIGRVAPQFGFVPMQQIRQTVRVVHIRRRRHCRMNHLCPAVDPDVRLHPEEPLIPLLRLVHVRIALLILVLRRRRGADDGRVDNGPTADLDAVGFQVLEYVLEQGGAEILALQQVTEAANRRLIGRALHAQVDADEATHRNRIVQRVFRRGIRQIEPLLKEVDSEHHLQFARWPASAGQGIDGSNQLAEAGPWHDFVHVAQELRPLRRLAVLLEAVTQGQLLAHSSLAMCSGMRDLIGDLFRSSLIKTKRIIRLAEIPAFPPRNTSLPTHCTL